jgi:Helix-turn-helix domain
MSLRKPQPSEQIRVISRRQPWAWFDKRIIRRYGRVLGPQGIAVYMALATHADGEEQKSFPSYQTIAKEISSSRSTVIRVMKILVRLNLIRKETMASPDGDAGPNIYSLLDVPVDNSLEEPVDNSKKQGGVVSQGHHGGVTGTLGVVSHRHPNKNLFEENTENKKEAKAVFHKILGNGKTTENRKALLRQQHEQLKEQGL